MEYHLETPISKEEILKLKAGDIVYLKGMVYTARDEAHIHAIQHAKKGEKLPLNFENAVVYHCGPIVKNENGKWHIIAAGPTTSARMNSLEPEFMKIFNPSGIIGKGGMSQEVAASMKDNKCVYFTMTGGVATLAAGAIKDVPDVLWYEELGMPEAIWFMDVEELGPLVVGIDAHGNSLYEDVKDITINNLKKIVDSI